MVETVMMTAAFFLMAAGLVALSRFVLGPGAIDRVVAFDVMTIATISVISMVAYFAGRIIYLDVAIVYGLLSFLGVIVVAKYIEKGL